MHYTDRGILQSFLAMNASRTLSSTISSIGGPMRSPASVLVAATEWRAGASASAEELRDWIDSRVAACYQRVDRVVIMADFPRHAAGKTLKREMQEPY